MSRRLDLLAALALAAASLVAPLAHADTNDVRGSSCIDSRKLEAWKSPSPDVIYYRVGQNAIFRLDLSTGSNQLKYSDVHLFTNSLTSSVWLCTPQDFNLRVTDARHTFVESLIVKSITRLTSDEVAALPPESRP